ncbi:hypothetical protein QYM36_008673, partial [Artemia franciscana]
MRDDEYFRVLYGKSKEMAINVGADLSETSALSSAIPVKSKRVQKISGRLRDYLTTTAIGKHNIDSESTTTEDKMRREFYEVLDRVLNEFEERFSVQLPVLEATRCLNPKSKDFMDSDLLLVIATYFDQAGIDTMQLKCQALIARAFVSQLPQKPANALDVFQRLGGLKEAYSELLKVVGPGEWEVQTQSMYFHHPQRSKYFQRWQLHLYNHAVNSSKINAVNQKKVVLFTRVHTELRLGKSQKSTNRAMFSNSATKYGKSESKKSKKTSQNKRSNKVNKYQVEQKAAVEEERRRLREELIQIFLQHKLEREQGLGRANQAKINEKWRKVLRDTKNEQIKEEIEQLREKFNFQIRLRQERILELTDQVILSEKNELDLNQSHIKNLGLLI